jgi:cysteine-rich repeat protein
MERDSHVSRFRRFVVSASRAGLLALLAAATIGLAADSASALTRLEIKCRDTVAKIARRAAGRSLQLRTACVRAKLYGRLPVGAVDCAEDPAALGGASTGDSGTDARLAKFVRAREVAGSRLTDLCDSVNLDVDIDPSDVLDAGSTCGGLATWQEVGECAVDVGLAAAKAVLAPIDLEPPFTPVIVGEKECYTRLARQVRQTLFHLSLWRSKCFRADDLALEGGGFYNCAANIAPPGAFNSTLYLKADKRLEEPMESLFLTTRTLCDVSLASVGFDATITEHTGGDFAGRLTTDDVFDNLNDVVTTEVNNLMAEFFPVGSYCGDGATDAGEECDDGNNLSNDGCDRDCTLSTGTCGNGAIDGAYSIEECDDGNNADGDGCSADCDLELCGNGRINLGWDEICDDGGESASCDDDCTPALCGDDEVNATAGEECDEGVLNDSGTPDRCGDGSGLRGACQLPFCGDDVADTGEECDDAGETIPCDTNCTTATCGDGDLNATRGETCDDGNAADDDSCPSSNTDGNLTASGHCLTATCGDGFVCTDADTCTTGLNGDPEECDTAGESVSCDDDCSLPACGDGNLNTFNTAVPATAAGEVCDDGNLVSGDGCDGNCTVTACGNGIVTDGPSGIIEVCDDGNQTNGDGCDDDTGSGGNCTVSVCGNGVVAGGEACDDSGESATCDANCTAVACGDGDLNATAGETCDDGGESATCDADCTPAVCGDGNINGAAGETCDDSGESVTCDANCTAAACGDGTTNSTAGEQCDTAGNSASCDSDCTFRQCGDGFINGAAGETCDDSGESATCDTNCTAAACGDATLNTSAGEQCDDGNLIGGDGCSAGCQVE